MSQTVAFSDVLDAAEHLDPEAQAERGRERIAAAVVDARREFASGQCKPMTAAKIVREALSILL